MQRPRLLIFASGSATGGGSGFNNLAQRAEEGVLDAELVGVVSNHKNGGVARYAEERHIPFFHFPAPWIAPRYQQIAQDTRAGFCACSGWLKQVVGLDPSTTFNIHPGPLPGFGGPGMYGHHVHEAVMGAYHRGEVTYTALCMHFVTEEYDRGPLIFRFNIRIREDDTPDTLGARVNRWEHYWQPEITNLVVQRSIRWSGNIRDAVYFPPGFEPIRRDE